MWLQWLKYNFIKRRKHFLCKHILQWLSGPSSFNPLGSLCGSDPPLNFNQKYLHLCSEDKQRSYGIGTAWGWVINDLIFIFGWTIPLNSNNIKLLSTALLKAFYPDNTESHLGNHFDCHSETNTYTVSLSSLVSHWTHLKLKIKATHRKVQIFDLDSIKFQGIQDSLSLKLKEVL